MSSMGPDELMQKIEKVAQTDATELSFFGENLTELPPEIGQLNNLQSLYLSYSQLSELPPEMHRMPQLQKLDLRGNPLPIAPGSLGPKDINRSPGDLKTILDIYFALEDPHATETLYEAKFLIVGEGGAGKTSLAKKIQNPNYDLDPDEESTHGIQVIQWRFPLDDGQDFRVNLWDFGGQEIYHQIHQFFLTERALYALVADTRKENTDFPYWLNSIELFGGDSPVLLIKNEKNDRPCTINEKQLRGDFEYIQEFLTTNQRVAQAKGRFTRDQLADIWRDPQYQAMEDELLQLMQKFRLCYPIPGLSGYYIAPQLLDFDPPDYDWIAEHDLNLRYEYEFMPKGIVTQLIVRLYR